MSCSNLIRIPCVAFLALPALLLLSGCMRAPGKLPANEIPVVDLATPRDATRTILMLIQAELKAIALNDRAALATIRGRELESIDADGIRKSLGASLRGSALLGDDPAAGLVNLWGSTISYYCDIIEYDGGNESVTPTPNTAILIIPAHSKTGEAKLSVALQRGADSKWRTSRITFAAPPVPISVPVTVGPPATTAPAQPAATGAPPASAPANAKPPTSAPAASQPAAG